MLTKIISGGQTGVDQYALRWAEDYGIATSGWAAKGWMTETGPAPWLADYGLEECPHEGYPARTRYNIKCSDGTALFGGMGSRGSQLAISIAQSYGKPLIKNPSPEQLVAWAKAHNIQVLNVGGNRFSRNPDAAYAAEKVLSRAFELLQNNLGDSWLN